LYLQRCRWCYREFRPLQYRNELWLQGRESSSRLGALSSFLPNSMSDMLHNVFKVLCCYIDPIRQVPNFFLLWVSCVCILDAISWWDIGPLFLYFPFFPLGWWVFVVLLGLAGFHHLYKWSQTNKQTKNALPRESMPITKHLHITKCSYSTKEHPLKSCPCLAHRSKSDLWSNTLSNNNIVFRIMRRSNRKQGFCVWL
jgi:hypothetical protein